MYIAYVVEPPSAPNDVVQTIDNIENVSGHFGQELKHSMNITNNFIQTLENLLHIFIHMSSKHAHSKSKHH